MKDEDATILQDQIIEYLKKKGYGVVLIDAIKIQRADPSRRMKFEVVVGFIGRKK